MPNGHSGEGRREMPHVEVSEAPPDARADLARAEREMIGEALRSREGIVGLRAWRGLDRTSSGTRVMRKFFDRMGALDRITVGQAEKMREIAAAGFGGLLGREEDGLALSTGASRIEELQGLFLAEKLGVELEAVRPEVRTIFQGLQKAGSSEGEVVVSDLLASGAVSFGVKAQWFDTQLASAVRFLERRDIEDARERAKEPPPDAVIEEKRRSPEENVPPGDQDSFAPSMEELERAKEGEPGAYFTISPFYGGYWREGDFDRWNPNTLRWERSEPRELRDVGVAAIDEKSRRVVYGTIRAGTRTPLPMAYGFVPLTPTLSHKGRGVVAILEDGRGGYVLEAGGEGLVSFSLEIGRAQRGVRAGEAPKQPLRIETGRLLEETERALEDAKRAGGSQLEQARAIKTYVRRALTYSNDSAMNAVHRGGRPADYFRRVEEHKKADCDVANTYFAALLSRLELPARLVTGHYVKVKDHAGAAVISSGTGHAWVEVFADGRWRRLDATPPGDPSMDEEELDEAEDPGRFEGDFGEVEPAVSEEELERMIAEAQKEIEKRERAPEERAAAAFAEQAGCTPEEAKLVVKQIEAARELRDGKGRKIRDLMVREFQKIVQENFVERLRYRAPVRLSEAHELVDPVEAMLDIRAGEAEPTGFARFERNVEREQVYGGMDVVLVADKSGSMKEGAASGRPRWQEQQLVLFLAMDALKTAADEFRRNRVRLMSPVDVRVGLMSFRADGATQELPLGAAWGPREQYQVWKKLQENIGGGTPDHLGMDAAGEALASGAVAGEKDRLRLVLEYSDGESDDPIAFARAIAELRSRGVVADSYRQDLAGFPEWLAGQVIAAAKELYPRKVKRSS